MIIILSFIWNASILLRDIVIIYNITNLSVSVKVDYNMSTEGGGQRQSNHVIIRPWELMPVRLYSTYFADVKELLLFYNSLKGSYGISIKMQIIISKAPYNVTYMELYVYFFHEESRGHDHRDKYNTLRLEGSLDLKSSQKNHYLICI